MKNKKTLLGIGLSGLALALLGVILIKSDAAIAAGEICELWNCEVGFYKNAAKTGCVACPDGTSCPAGSTSVEACQSAGCGPAVTGSFITAPTTGLCTSESSSSSMNTGDSKFSWTCTYLGSATSCNATRAYNCNGTTPGGTGYTRGGFTRPYGYTPTSWTYTSDQTPGACQWTCKSGYEKSGNDCVVKSAQCGTATVNWYVTAPTESLCTYGTPSIVTSGNNTFTWTCTNLTSTDNCSATRKYSCGTAPSGNGVSKGSYFRDYNYTPASWTYSTNSPLGSCEWKCKDGYEKSGNTCVASSAQCGPAYGGTYTSAPTTGLCDLGDSSVVTPWDFTYTWTCTHLTNTANCNATRNHFCEGTTPSGDGVNRGLMTASTPKDWTYKAEGTLGECEWSCDEGYTSGANNTCVSLPAQCGTPDGGLVAPTTGLCNRGTPSSVTGWDSEFTWTCSYQGNSTNCSAPRTYLCNGTTPPTSNGTLKGSFTREYSYAPTSWTYKAEGELGPCQWRCKGGYLSGGGNTCIASDFKELEMYVLTDTGATGYSAMMDRNLGATAYLNEPGKTTGEWYGSYYQWGNNYGFPNQGTINTSSTQVNASSYGPNNPYSSDIFITSSSVWDSSDNANLWGGTSSLISDKKGPCPPNYHVPTKDEFVALVNGWKKAMNDTSTSQWNSIPGMTSQWSLDSLMPFAGYLDYSSAGADYQESRGIYWSSMRDSTEMASILLFTSYINPKHYLNRASGAPVRCFRNLQTPSTTLHPNGGTGAVIVVHDGTITKLGTPTKGTEVFGGWYRNEGLTSEVLLNQTAPTHLYAKWETAQCGTANGQSYLSLTSSSAGLCGTGTVGNFSSSTTGFTWECTYQTNVASCSASRASVCSGTVPHGDRVVTGASTYSNGYTPTSWTYKAEGELGACQWRCTAGYMQGPDNTCVVGVGQCGTAAGNSHTDLSASSANLCAGGQVSQFYQAGATYSWKCYGISNQVNCCATQSIERSNRVQEGAGTFKICNPNNSEECLTLQNHDLGSNVPGLCSPSYGKYYQWGNNYGFSNAGSVSTSSTQVTCNNPPYNRSQFVIGFKSWCTETESSVVRNLWGGVTDINLNTNNGYPVLNPSDRQGPCPSGYHVPSKGEWKKVMQRWVDWYNLDGNSVTINTTSNNYKFTDGTAIKMFQNDFLIPLGGSRTHSSSTSITNQGSTAWLWTTTPDGSVGASSSFYLYTNNLGIGENDRADGVSVRCFKNNTLSQCGPASTGSFVTAPTDSLCNPGTPSAVTSGSSTFTWTCTYGASVSNCSATRMYPCGGTTPSGNGVTKGGVMATTSKSWTYKANGELGACEWRCNGGYTQGTNNTCDAAGYSDLEMYFLTDAGATGYYAMMDRNLGATAYMNEPGKTASEWYGNYFQWGNNYGFPNQGTVNTSTTQVDSSGYGPGNPYSSGTFIKTNGDWSIITNNNLWGGETNTFDAKKGPCPSGYHVPSYNEMNNIINDWTGSAIDWTNTNYGYQRSLDSLMPLAGIRINSTAGIYGDETYYWSSMKYSNTHVYTIGMMNDSLGILLVGSRAYGGSVRCFKNTQTPSRIINPNGGTGALIVVHDGKITKLGTPTKGTEVFGGWYRDSSFSSQVHTGENMPNLYAKWEVAQCGSASGQSYVSLTSSSAGLCSKGNVGNFSTTTTGYTWKCTHGSNVTSCSATRVYTCGGTLPHGDYVVTGASTYTNGYTPTSWTYVAGNGTLGTCQWSCDEGYTSGVNNTCVELQAQCGTAAGNSHTNLSVSSANLCAGGEVTQFFQAGATYSWSCVVSSNNKQQCCATQSLSRDSRIQLGDGTFTICNPNNSDECLTIQNRDVGSNTPGLCPPSYGNFYQRGNSYGFSSSGNVSTSSTQVTCSNPPYNRSQFVVGFKNRCTGAQNNVMGNLWGGYLDVSNLNTHYGYPMLNQTDRQGPCPSGYHVPSISEWRKVIDRWVDRYNGAGNSVTIGDQGNQHIIVSDGMAAKMFQNDFLIPFAGLRERTAGEISNQRISSFLWTSTPLGSIGGATAFGLDSNHFGLSDNDRAYGDSVRCFKNYTLPQCGSASGQTYVTLTNTSAGLCDASNTVLDFQSGSNKFTWKCSLGGVTVDCGATRRYNCEGQMPSGVGVSTGSNIVNTPTSWTYSPTGTLGACQWRCADGYVSGANNTCVEPQCQTNFSDFQDLDMYFLTTRADWGIQHYTLMDRNLGATQIYTGINNVDTYGYFYQWGNNCGFPSQGTLDTSTTQVSTQGYGSGNYYLGNVFITTTSPFDWSSNQNDDLWGDVTDTLEARQGPCPSGYHVPTYSDVQIMKSYWKKSLNDSSIDELTQWTLDFFMPLTSYRKNTSVVADNGSTYYWFSDAATSTRQGGCLYLKTTANPNGGCGRGLGLPVRCFKNSSNTSMNIYPNGGSGTVIVVHNGVIAKLGTPSKGTEVFGGWYRDPSFNSQVNTGEVAPSNLYAKWEIQCQAGYYSDGGTCAQCTAGYYCPGDNTRHPCGAGKYSLAGATSCLNVDCGCKGTSTTATTSCPTVCPDGQYSSAGSSTCQYCGNGPSNSVYTHSSSRLCTNSCPWMCADGFVEEDGNCVCEPGTYFDESEGKCMPCPEGYKKGGAGAVGIEQCMAHCEGGTYVENKFDKCVECPAGTAIPEHEVGYGSISLEMGEAYHCEECQNLPKDGHAHYTGPSNDITTCPWECDADWYRDNIKNLCNYCIIENGYHSDPGSDSYTDCVVTCPAGTHVAAENQKCVACPEGMAVASHQVHEGSTSTCVSCNEEYLPTNATFSGAGSNPNNCPWKCNAGYYKLGNTCRSCSEFNTSSAQYSSNTGATSSFDCYQLPKCGSSSGQSFVVQDYPSGPVSNLCEVGNSSSVTVQTQCIGSKVVAVGWKWNCVDDFGHSVNCSAHKLERATIIGDDSTRNNFVYDTIYIGSNIALMDRNLGAKSVWDGTTWNVGTEADYYGYYYQWGNNWGFSSKTTTVGAQSQITVPAGNMPSNYSNNKWNRANPWSIQTDLWGNDTNTKVARKGPCPEGWHVPSSGEWVAIYNAWNSWSNKSTSESSVGRNFAKDLKLPPNGTHSSHDDPNAIAEYNKLYWFYRGSYGYYWSSTPVNNYYAYLVRFPRGTSNLVDYATNEYRKNGRGVRCLKNTISSYNNQFCNTQIPDIVDPAIGGGGGFVAP